MLGPSSITLTHCQSATTFQAIDRPVSRPSPPIDLQSISHDAPAFLLLPLPETERSCARPSCHKTTIPLPDGPGPAVLRQREANDPTGPVMP
jgi:hypothetical protein